MTAIACFKASGATIGGGVRLGLRIGAVELLPFIGTSPSSSSSESSEMIFRFLFDGRLRFFGRLRVKYKTERKTVV